MAMTRVTVDGHTLNKRTANMLHRAEQRLGLNLRVLQGSYHAGSLSAGTHLGGGAVDVAPVAGRNHDIVLQLRKVGFAAWHRTPSQGPWTEHIHAIAIGDPEMSESARAQVHDYYNRRNGLAGHGPDDGPRLDPIPTWYVPLGRIYLHVAENAFRATKKRKTMAVSKIQHLLNYRMNAGLKVDGIAGPKTKQAYLHWERHLNGPKPYDGIPGPFSLGKLVAGYYRVLK